MSNVLNDVIEGLAGIGKQCVVLSIERATSKVSNILYSGWESNIEVGEVIWDVAAPVREEDSEFIWSIHDDLLNSQTHTVRFVKYKSNFDSTGLMTITTSNDSDAENVMAVLMLQPHSDISATRLLEMTDQFNKALPLVKTFPEGLDLIGNILSQCSRHCLLVIEINNPLDSKYYCLKICAGTPTQGLSNGLISDALSRGVNTNCVDASGDVGTILVDEGIIKKADPTRILSAIPINLSGFNLGAITLLLRPRAGAPGKADEQLLRVSASLISRFIEHLMTSISARSAEDTRKNLESRVLQIDSDRVEEKDILSMVAYFSDPFASSKSIDQLAKEIGSCSKLFTEDVTVLPAQVRPLVQAFRLVSQRGRWASLEKEVVFDNWQELMEYCQDTVGRRRHEEAVVFSSIPKAA